MFGTEYGIAVHQIKFHFVGGMTPQIIYTVRELVLVLQDELVHLSCLFRREVATVCLLNVVPSVHSCVYSCCRHLTGVGACAPSLGFWAAFRPTIQIWASG